MVTSPDKPLDKYAELAALFRAGIMGDAASYTLFLQKISTLLRRILGRRLPASDLEDVVQEVLISVHKARHTYDGQRPLMPWLLAIARFRVNDYLRKLYVRAQRETVTENIAETPADDVTETYSETESLDELLQDIPERQRRILTMLYMEGHTARETGKRLNMNESAVKVAAHRAIKKIRERLGT